MKHKTQVKNSRKKTQALGGACLGLPKLVILESIRNIFLLGGSTEASQREVVVECFAPYDDHRWVNIGKQRDGMAPDAVQYARALRPPYHLLSFLRVKGHSTKGMSCTDKNTMVR